MSCGMSLTGREAILDKGPGETIFLTVISPDKQRLARIDHYEDRREASDSSRRLEAAGFVPPWNLMTQFIFTPPGRQMAPLSRYEFGRKAWTFPRCR